MIGGHDAAMAPGDADRSHWLRLQARRAELARGSGATAIAAHVDAPAPAGAAIAGAGRRCNRRRRIGYP